MKKQVLAGAVAAAIAAPLAASADVTVYGQLHYSIDSINYGSSLGVTRLPLPLQYSASIPGTGMDSLATGFDGMSVNSHYSRFGIKGSEDLGGGLSALFQMEFSIDGDDLGGVNNDRNTYVALAGNWGVAGIGQVDTPYKSSTASLELFSETIGDYNQLYFDDIRAQDAVFYMSPNWNGLSFVAAVVLPSTSNDADGIEATSVSGTYQNGPFFASLAYETLSGEFVGDLYSSSTNTLDYDKWRLGLGYTANGFHVGFIYEDRDIDIIGDGNSWQLSGSYTMGNNTFKLAYGEVSDVVNDTSLGFSAGSSGSGVLDVDGEQWSIGMDHRLSTQTKVYAAYTDFNDHEANMDWDALSLGIVHTF
jgi:predicted porin